MISRETAINIVYRSIFGEYFFKPLCHVTKHTPECTKLHYIEINSPVSNNPSMLLNLPSDIPQRDVFQHLLFSKIIPPMFEHGFRSLMYICFKANKVYYSQCAMYQL